LTHDPDSAGISRRHALAWLGAGLAGCSGGGGKPATAGSEGGGRGGDTQYGGLRVSGSQIVDLQGHPVMLRGMNWGRWGLAQPQDAADNVAQGANCVRIPLRWWGLYTSGVDGRQDGAWATGGVDTAHLTILDQMVSWASQAGLWIILFVDSDCGQDGQQTPEEAAYCDPQGQFPGGHNFWSDADARARFIGVWKFVAERYRSTPHLGLFEPLPEPDPALASDADIQQFYVQVTDAIRSVAPGVPFLLGARSYDITRCAAAYDAAWKDVVYTGNLFVNTSGTQADNIAQLGVRAQFLFDLRSARNVPVFVQQVGVQSGQDPGQAYLDAVLTLLTGNGVGFTWWLYRDNATTDGFGVTYQADGGSWIVKTPVLEALESYFNAA